MTDDSPPCTDEDLSRVRARVDRLEHVVDALLHELKVTAHYCTVALYDAPEKDEGEERGDGA